MYLYNEQLQNLDVRRLTEDDACHGRGQTKLLLEELGPKRYESLDNNGIKHAVKHSKHIRTVGNQRLDSFQYSSETCCPQIQ